MNREDIIRMAIEAKFNLYVNDLTEMQYIEVIEAFATLVAAAEREACARVAEEYATGESRDYSENIAEEIRARGENK